MIQELKDNYGHLFEDALLNEINQVGTFKEVPEGFKMMEISDGVFNVVVTKSPTELNEKQILDLKAKLSEKLRADGEFVSSMSIEVLKSTKSKRTRTITQNVKDRVWNRDGGKCVQCDSNENLEFDHIIPFSKGGANTYRNIQLLCEQCNRQKSNKIG